VAPEIPVTVAVYVKVPPKLGFDGAETTVTTGVAAVTTKEVGEEVGREE
jgi:hypothetical protein